MTRYVGVNDKGQANSWHRRDENIEPEWIEKIERDGSKLFGAGPDSIIQVIAYIESSVRRKLLIDAMTRIEEAPAGQGFVLLRFEDYMLWRDGAISNSPRTSVKPRKIFESDFEKLSEDGMLLTREPVSAEDAWNATLLACGVKRHDTKGD